jgi:hypothetical protein
MGGLWFLRRPVVLLGLLAVVGVSLVAIGSWTSSRHSTHFSDCLAGALVDEKSAAAPLVASMDRTPVPTVLHGMAVGQTAWGAPVIGPWTTRLPGRITAARIAAWLPHRYLAQPHLTSATYPAGREWTLRADDTLGHGVFLQITIKPLESGHLSDVVGYIGVPAVTEC